LQNNILTFQVKTWERIPHPKVYGDLALLGDREQGYTQWYYPNSEKGWQKSFFIYSKWHAN